ncbi:hypothetical protein [Sedimenticola hydrogenitrophicus]|uniref:hypothetical protein n=1 Tax=Sedimenticola hydrogenitrophicus TaxID=2967975 RepID=UPI0023B0DB8E|nr:hypothetical protein [Sedimenticola hydrogenitrophicus]
MDDKMRNPRPGSLAASGNGGEDNFYKLPGKRIPNCPPSQLDSYYRADMAYSFLTGRRRPVTYRTTVAALAAAEFIAAWEKMEAATDEAIRYGFFKIALRILIGIQAHHGKDVRLGRGRLL